MRRISTTCALIASESHRVPTRPAPVPGTDRPDAVGRARVLERGSLGRGRPRAAACPAPGGACFRPRRASACPHTAIGVPSGRRSRISVSAEGRVFPQIRARAARDDPGRSLALRLAQPGRWPRALPPISLAGLARRPDPRRAPTPPIQAASVDHHHRSRPAPSAAGPVPQPGLGRTPKLVARSVLAQRDCYRLGTPSQRATSHPISRRCDNPCGALTPGRSQPSFFFRGPRVFFSGAATSAGSATALSGSRSAAFATLLRRC